MPISITNEAKQQKNELSSFGQFLTLFEITFVDGTVKRFVINNENVYFPSLIPFAALDSLTTGLAWDGSNLWSVGQTSGKIFMHNADGSEQSSFTTGLTNLYGLAFDGTYLWTISSTTDNLYKYTTSGTLDNQFSIVAKSRGVEYVNSKLYVIHGDTGVVNVYDTSGNSLGVEGVSSLPKNGDGYKDLAWDGSNFWVANRNKNSIIRIDLTASGSHCEIDLPYSAYGLAYDNVNLWHSDIDVDKIYKIATSGQLRSSNTDSSKLYEPLAMVYKQQGDGSVGESPRLTLTVSDPFRIIRSYIQDHGVIGASVTKKVVSSINLDNASPYISEDFEATEVIETNNTVMFTLNSQNPLEKRFPKNRMLKNHCINKFKDSFCGYSNHSLVSSKYIWTISGSGTNEYYVTLVGSENPNLIKPDKLYENSVEISEASIGSLTAGSWAYGNNDDLGWNTIYVRLTDNVDPDTKASGYIEHEMSSCNKTLADCRDRQNTSRYNAFPTVGTRGLVI